MFSAVEQLPVTGGKPIAGTGPVNQIPVSDPSLFLPMVSSDEYDHVLTSYPVFLRIGGRFSEYKRGIERSPSSLHLSDMKSQTFLLLGHRIALLSLLLAPLLTVRPLRAFKRVCESLMLMNPQVPSQSSSKYIVPISSGGFTSMRGLLGLMETPTA